MQSQRLVTGMFVVAACFAMSCLDDGTIALSRTVRAQEAAGSPEAKQRELVREAVKKAVGEYQFFAGASATEPLASKIVNSWINETRSSSGGVLALWTHEGRPVMSGHVYDYGGELRHEFFNLARGKVVCRQTDELVWEPESGPEFRPVPGAPIPAETAFARMRQMKTISSQFTGILKGWKGNITSENLRLLPKEIFRYESGAANAVDGAVFAFAQGTDPEVLLLVETMRLADGKSRWEYALVRGTSGILAVNLNGEEVWTCDQLDFSTSMTYKGDHRVFARQLTLDNVKTPAPEDKTPAE